MTSPEQILGIMAKGFEHRATGCHDINAHSSRSHCLLVIHAAATDPTTGVRSVGKLTLCDLAGSERINKTGATGESTHVLAVSSLLTEPTTARGLCILPMLERDGCPKAQAQY